MRRLSIPASLRTFLFAMVYLAIGVLFYHTQETHECDDGTPDCSWTVVDALYFSVVTISTVGYGDLTPSKDGTKVFTLFYIFFGITCVFSDVANSISGVLAEMEIQFLMFVDRFDTKTAKEHDEEEKAQKARQSLREQDTPNAPVTRASSSGSLSGSRALSAETQLSGRQLGLSGKVIDLNGDGTPDYVMPPSAAIFWGQRMALWCVLALVLQLISAEIFTLLDSSLSYLDAFYHSFVTATTVGYGDVSMSTESMKIFACIHIIISVTFLAALIGRVQDLAALRGSEVQRCAALTTEFTPEYLMPMDKDGLGIDQVEFIVGMLGRCGVELCGEPLRWKEVKPLLALFEQADVHKTGRINQEDLKHLAEKRGLQLHLPGMEGSAVKDSDGPNLAQVVPT